MIFEKKIKISDLSFVPKIGFYGFLMVIFLENHIKYTIFDRQRDRPRIVQGKIYILKIMCDQLVRNSAILL